MADIQATTFCDLSQSQRGRFSRRTALHAAGAMTLGASWLFAPESLHAQDAWPTKPVKMIIPFPPGQATDIFGRLFAQRLSGLWGQGVVVENRPGGSSIIGMEALKNAPADGYTLGMVSSGPLSINPSVFSRLPYDPVRDFTPISLAFIAPLVLLVNKDLPVQTTAELVNLMRQQPGRLSYASGGPGTSQHLACELFKMATKTFAVHIPYKGSGPALTDLIAGQVHFMIDSVSAALPHIQAGRIRPLAVTSVQRNAALPQVPSLAESGVTGLEKFEAVGWAGLVGPANMPAPVVQKISQDFASVLRDEALNQRVAQSGSVVRALPGAEFSQFIRDEVVKWGAAAKASNTRLDA
jgi:tripartite-type tricarboxylate transporter receptor subunit TctC